MVKASEAKTDMEPPPPLLARKTKPHSRNGKTASAPSLSSNVRDPLSNKVVDNVKNRHTSKDSWSSDSDSSNFW